MAIARPRGNVPKSPLRWTIERASIEFRIAPNTLRKFLNQGGAEPDEGGCYSTTQICESLFGDLKAERMRKECQLTKKYSLENQITEARFLDRSEIAKGLAMVADAMVSRIVASEMSRTAKDDLLMQLSSLPLVLKETADRQTKLRRGSNGNGNDSED